MKEQNSDEALRELAENVGEYVLAKNEVFRPFRQPAKCPPDNATSKNEPSSAKTGTGGRVSRKSSRSASQGHDGGKYHISPPEDRTYNGVTYASKKEASYAAELDLRVRAGEIDFWLRQVPFPLPGKTKSGRPYVYQLDFMTFSPFLEGSCNANYIEFTEVKGFPTPMGELKRKQVEEIYHIHIKVV